MALVSTNVRSAEKIYLAKEGLVSDITGINLPFPHIGKKTIMARLLAAQCPYLGVHYIRLFSRVGKRGEDSFYTR